MGKRTKRRAKHTTCIYCRKAAGTKEHIIATRFIEVLRKDPRGLRLPIVLTATLPDGSERQIGGKQTKRGHYTLEYTTRVCDRCNSGWMNDIDTHAYPYVAEMIRGNPVTLDHAARSAIAAWVCKVAVTARSAPHSLQPIEVAWTDWLYQHHSAPPGWYVWIGRYVGLRPWWYNTQDVRVELGPGSAPAPPGFVRDNGVLATLVIGYLATQVFGVGGSGVIDCPDREAAFPLAWPTPASAALPWPPSAHIDDTGLPLWAERLLAR